jgi:hypothetical protein
MLVRVKKYAQAGGAAPKIDSWVCVEILTHFSEVFDVHPERES